MGILTDDLPVEKPTNPKFIDFEGRRFGAVVVTRYLGKQGAKSYWEYRCDCGTVKSTSGTNLLLIKSCGCLHNAAISERRTSHGASRQNSRSPEYIAWSGMRSRCHTKTSEAYRLYGGRGITICDRWNFGENGMSGFECFLEDMGPRPSSKHSIDRYPDNDGNYELGNCRWATAKEQQSNRSGCHWVLWNDERITLQEACDRSSLPNVTVHARIKRGWDLNRALKTPSASGAGADLSVTISDLGTEKRT